MYAVSPVVHTSNVSSCQKKLFKFSCGCEKFYEGRSFGFLVIFVITENRMKRPVLLIRLLWDSIFRHSFQMFRPFYFIATAVIVFMSAVSRFTIISSSHSLFVIIYPATAMIIHLLPFSFRLC
jgi:hypothetical protein